MNSIFDLPVYKTLYKIVAPRPWNFRDQYNFPESQEETKSFPLSFAK